MSDVTLKDTVFFEVPLSPEALRRLHRVAEKKNTTPLLVLKTIVEHYQRNGGPPQPPQRHEDSDVRRGVPVTFSLLRQLNQLEAESGYSRRSLDLLRAIVEDGLLREEAEVEKHRSDR
jgi:hypothetical protein